MAILFRSDDGSRLPDVVLFGSGTVGRPTRRHLEVHGLRVEYGIAVPWTDDDARRATLHRIGTQLRARLRQRPLRVIWAAGAAGFSASTEETAREAAAFEDVVELVEDLLGRGSDHRSVLHVVSSAGGLFEGRTIRSADAVPSPLRAYGELKLLQEQTATALGPGRVVVHRPSSIYSSSTYGRRPGLIGTLVENMAAQRPTTIYGAPTTLRDYVHADDVGRHIAAAAVTDQEQASPQLLVSGRPASIHEVVVVVEKSMGRPVHLRYVDAWNTRDIVFAQSARTPTFRPVPLHVGVRRMRTELLTRPLRIL